LTLAVVALGLLVELPLLRVAQAARITTPALHVKAYKADSEKTDANWPTDPVLCDLVIDGDIEEGDGKALEQAFGTIVGSMNAFTFFLCLRSTGGDLREAVKIARFVLRTQRPSIGTVIEDGQTCASACAIIFLAGNAPARVGSWPQRFLHPRGKLLYHSSVVDLGNFPDDKHLLAYLTEPTTDPRGLKGKIADLYNDGLSDVQRVINTFQALTFQREQIGDRWVRPSLFLEMFAQNPDEWICIDNVDAVGRWNIQVYGYQPPNQPKKQNYSDVCRNAYSWRSDRFAASEEDELEQIGDLKRPPATATLAERNQSNAKFDDRFSMSFQARLQPLTCVIELDYGDEKKHLNEQSILTTFFLGSGPLTLTRGIWSVAVSELGPTAYYPPATLLRDLPGIHPAPDRDASRTRPAIDFTDYPNTVMNGCSYKSIPKIERGACQATCAVDPACQAYSHNKITQMCELKHTLTALRLDPLWTSGVPSTAPAPGRSILPNSMVAYSERCSDPSKVDCTRIQGKLIDEAKAEGQDACWDRCESDPMCLAVEFWWAIDKELCRRFSEVTGLREEATEEGVEIELKRQQ
jgi:hypothetical protein